MDLRSSVRIGEWLEVPLFGTNDDEEDLMAGSHPHQVRQWLLARAVFPAKWVNRLFSVGGIKLQEDKLLLHAFPRFALAEQPLGRGTAGSPWEGPVPVVLFEDDFCLVLHKPAGMAVHPSRPGHLGTLDEAAVRHCLAAGQDVPVRHIHRLDDDTSGPVLYAKNDLAQWRLDEDMRNKDIDRRYLALVTGLPVPERDTIDAPIGADRHQQGKRRVSPSGDKAVTHYAIEERYERASLVRITLETGRTHQIRVHFSHIGYPLIGDQLYGGRDPLLRHQALHGESLHFRHPWTLDPVIVEAPLPEWFEEMRQRLRDSRN